MATKLKTIGVAAGLIAAAGFASPAAFACSGKWSSAGDSRIFAQNATSGSDRSDVQKQTDPAKNGTSQSEDQSGANKNGQPQK
jgi:hypothetical protein